MRSLRKTSNVGQAGNITSIFFAMGPEPLQLMVALFYHLGLRVFELCQARWDDFKIIQGQCWYCLVGKGGKAGQIPVNEELLDLVQRYRGYYQLTVNVSEFDTGLIFVSKRTGGQLSHSRVRQIIKGVFRKASEQVEGKAKKEKLCKCSPHCNVPLLMRVKRDFCFAIC